MRPGGCREDVHGLSVAFEVANVPAAGSASKTKEFEAEAFANGDARQIQQRRAARRSNTDTTI